MMARTVVKVSGLRELDRALGELPKATGKNVLRRTLRKAAEPIVADAAAKAPVLTGALKISIGIGSKLTKRQSLQHRKMFRDDRAAVEIFAGAGGLVQATQTEFGNEHQAADPYMRPAWDGNKDRALEIVKTELGTEIIKAARRLAKKSARGK